MLVLTVGDAGVVSPEQLLRGVDGSVRVLGDVEPVEGWVAPEIRYWRKGREDVRWDKVNVWRMG